MNSSSGKIPVAVSSCLLGQEVRYDGGHKINTYIVEILGKFFELIPFCPEVASGMSTPRPPIQLKVTNQEIRCVEVNNQHLDMTEQLVVCAENQNHWLNNLCGYILKKDSPSCGMERVKVYNKEQVNRTGTGIFARYVLQHFPLLPVEEEDRMSDPWLRRNFIQRVYVMHRWKNLMNGQLTPNKLMVFHSRHKLIAMSHDQNDAHDLGRLAASATKDNINEVIHAYGPGLMGCLKKIARRRNRIPFKPSQRFWSSSSR